MLLTLVFHLLLMYETSGRQSDNDIGDVTNLNDDDIMNDCNFNQYFNYRMQSMHPSLIPLECNAKSMANGNENVKNHRLMSLNPNMNHGHLHANKIAEIMNNAIGNPTRLKELPHPILDNDKMHLIDYHLVSCFKSSKLICIISHFLYDRATIEIMKFETRPYISRFFTRSRVTFQFQNVNAPQLIFLYYFFFCSQPIRLKQSQIGL